MIEDSGWLPLHAGTGGDDKGLKKQDWRNERYV